MAMHRTDIKSGVILAGMMVPDLFRYDLIKQEGIKRNVSTVYFQLQPAKPGTNRFTTT